MNCSREQSHIHTVLGFFFLQLLKQQSKDLSVHFWLFLSLHTTREKKGYSLCFSRVCTLSGFRVMMHTLFRGVVGVFCCWLQCFKMFCYLRLIQNVILAVHTARASLFGKEENFLQFFFLLQTNSSNNRMLFHQQLYL